MSEYGIGKDHWTIIVAFAGILILAGIVSVAGPFVENIGAIGTDTATGTDGAGSRMDVVPVETEEKETETNIVSVSEVGETRVWYSVEGIPQKISSKSADFVDIRTENNELKFSINSDIEGNMWYRVDVIIVLYYEHPQLSASYREFERTLSEGYFSKDGRNVEADLTPFTEIDYEGLEKMGMDRRYLRMEVEQMRFMAYR